MAIKNPDISIITQSINGLKLTKTKRHTVTNLIKRQYPNICCLQQTHLSWKDKSGLKVKGWKIILQANGIQGKVSIDILISDKIYLKFFKGIIIKIIIIKT